MKFHAYLLLICVSLVNCNVEKQPNIVMIIADDAGFNDVGHHGNNALKTPNIDALGYNGIILNSHYAMPTCTPSRAALLTGKYSIRTGFQGWPIISGENRALPPDVPLMPELLKPLGYSTHLVGKWHLGHAYRNETPVARGFDSFFGYWTGFIGYENYVSANSMFNGIDIQEGYEPVKTVIGQYATDVFNDRAEQIIDNHDKEKPLFLMLSHLAPHTGWDGVELGLLNKTANDIEFRHITNTRRREYAGVIKTFDDSVGKIVKSLSKNGMLEDTIIVVFSDNGGPTVDLYSNTASNWPLRGIKGSLSDGGVRTFSVVWSSRFKYKGVVKNDLFHISDWLPTFYAAAGGDVKALGKIDGINQWDNLVNNKKSKRDEMLINVDEKRKEAGIIGYRGAFKLIEAPRNDSNRYYGYFGETDENRPTIFLDYESILNSDVNEEIGSLPKTRRLMIFDIIALRFRASLPNCRREHVSTDLKLALFDLKRDPCETTNVAHLYPAIVNKLMSRLNVFKAELVPQKNTNVDPCSNPKYYDGYWTTWLSNPSPECTSTM